MNSGESVAPDPWAEWVPCEPLFELHDGWVADKWETNGRMCRYEATRAFGDCVVTITTMWGAPPWHDAITDRGRHATDHLNAYMAIFGDKVLQEHRLALRTRS